MRSIILIAFALLLSVTALAEDSNSRTIKIGVLTDLSGPAAYWGLQAQLGASIAADQINSQTANSLKLVFEDHQLNTAQAVTAAHKLINLDKVEAIYSEFSSPSVAASPVAKNAKLLFLFSAAAASPLKSNPYAFKSYVDYELGCRDIAAYWKKSRIKKVGILKANAEFGEICSVGAKQIYPKLIELTYNYGEDVSTQVLILKNKGIEAVLNVTYEPDTLRMMKAMKAINYEAIIGANEDAITQKSLSQYPAKVAKSILFAFSSINKAFLAKVKKIDPDNEMISPEALALGYLHITQLYNALSNCAARDIDCQRKILSSSPKDDIIAFLGWKDRVAEIDVALKVWKQGELKTVQDL